MYSNSSESIQPQRDSLLDQSNVWEAEYRRSDAEDTEDSEFDDLLSPSASQSWFRSQAENLSPAPSRGTEFRDPGDDDPTSEFDDATPREILDALIQNYTHQALVEIDDVCYDKAEQYQRKVIACAMESNQAYGCHHNIQEAKRVLADILKRIDSDRSRHEAREINASLFRPTPQLTPQISQDFSIALKPEVERLEHSKFYLQRAEVEYQEYCKTFKDLKALNSSEKYAKRTFKLTLDLGDEGKQEFLRSVGHLIKGTFSFDTNTTLGALSNPSSFPSIPIGVAISHLVLISVSCYALHRTYLSPRA